jgi:hypothetical protein
MRHVLYAVQQDVCLAAAGTARRRLERPSRLRAAPESRAGVCARRRVARGFAQFDAIGSREPKPQRGSGRCQALQLARCRTVRHCSVAGGAVVA